MTGSKVDTSEDLRYKVRRHQQPPSLVAQSLRTSWLRHDGLLDDWHT